MISNSFPAVNTVFYFLYPILHTLDAFITWLEGKEEMKCNETKFTDSNLRKASEVELESDTQKCSQNFCLLRLSFYLCFSPCDKFTVSG